MVPPLLGGTNDVPTALWAPRGLDGMRHAGGVSLGTSAPVVPSADLSRPQALPLANHREADGVRAGRELRPTRHGSSE
jgi:hypothetical protein